MLLEHPKMNGYGHSYDGLDGELTKISLAKVDHYSLF